ncbi:phenylalanine--tRNA ligase subunit alpha [Candidatus Pacearchaeota archaeon]|nr:phenylalanine--tRNA ligase subunit alpha [Candidatus Pacearchaeota archaeon]
MKKADDIIDELSPIERKILPYLDERNVSQIARKSGLDKTSVLRALEFLANKNLVNLRIEKRKIVELGVNGILYNRNGLPERRLLNLLYEKQILSLDDAKKASRLSDNEFKAAIGALKKKAFAELRNGKLILTAKKEEISKKSLEENFLSSLPLEHDKLQPEQAHSLKNLLQRRDIVKIEEKKEVIFELTESGREIVRIAPIKTEELIEQLTPEIITAESWRGKRFRRYDIISPVPKLYGGKRHFVNQAIEHGRKIWTEMGFKEMTGNLAQTGFWNFDALFTAQDHPVREIHDTFYIKDAKGKLPEKTAERVKKAHEQGVNGSKGWQYKWSEDEAKRVVLRTHTTALSAHTLAKLGEKNLKELPAKFFAIGKCFRNDTVDWNHGFEFNQTEGIVIDENANFRHLIGYLKEFAKKMGYDNVRFRPHYFPYTEPSLEGDIWNEDKKQWIEVFAAGIFRPEVTEPLLGKPIPVLAWGPGFDRMMMMLYKIKDFREIYKNDLAQLRRIKFFDDKR